VTVRGRWPLTRDSSLTTSLGFGMAAMANAVGRRHLARFIDRTVFHDARERLPFVDDAPFGGGAGMVMAPEPLFAAVEAADPVRPLLLLSAQRLGRDTAER